MHVCMYASTLTVMYASTVEHPDHGLALRVIRVVEGGDPLKAEGRALIYMHVAALELGETGHLNASAPGAPRHRPSIL